MSKGFENRAEVYDSIPEFYSISTRILWIPAIFEMTPKGYREKMQWAVEAAKWDRIAMAVCMRELQSMAFVLKTPFISNSPRDIWDLWKLIEKWDGFSAYKFLQRTMWKSDADVESATIYIEQQQELNNDVSNLLESVKGKNNTIIPPKTS